MAKLHETMIKSRRWRDGGKDTDVRQTEEWQITGEPAKLLSRMEKPMQIRKVLIAGLMLVHAWALAQTVEAPSPLSLDEARVQRAKGKALKDEAEARYEADKAACQGKVIAIGCMSSAKERRTAAVKEADALEREGRKAEREIHRQEVEAKAAQRAAEAPGLEARQKADVERYREKEAQRAAERERRQAEEAKKLESRRSKVAAERAAQQQKLAARSQEDAKRAEKAPENARKSAERKRQHAERVKKIDERSRQYAELLKRREAEEAAKKAAPAAAGK